jgi:hypothetical protein
LPCVCQPVRAVDRNSAGGGLGRGLASREQVNPGLALGRLSRRRLNLVRIVSDRGSWRTDCKARRASPSTGWAKGIGETNEAMGTLIDVAVPTARPVGRAGGVLRTRS